MNLVIANEDTTGEWKTNIRGPLQCRGQCELFSILMHYVCIKGRGWMRVFFFFLFLHPLLCVGMHASVCVCALDSANSDLHFPWTACEMFSDMGSVTAIIYKAHPTPLNPPFSQPLSSATKRCLRENMGTERAKTQLVAMQEQEIKKWGKMRGVKCKFTF